MSAFDRREAALTVPRPDACVLTFCHTLALPGDLSGVPITGITAQIGQTLPPFATIRTVQLLTSSGRCFNVLSGQNNC
jgi:hypothetical protein